MPRKTALRSVEGGKPEAATPSDEDLQVASLLRLVGARVRALRAERDLSRKALSEASGVSLRYLAQLEGGEGNISLGLLSRVATALDKPIEALIRVEDPQAAEIAHVAALFGKADEETQKKVMALLDPGRTRAMKAERICLIGLRGAGKSTLGAMMAEDFGMPFVELNREIEKSAGVPVREIIALYGEEGYREFEADALGRIIADHDRAIVAVAGGLVSSQDTFGQVLSRFHTVWIKAAPGDHMERVRLQGDLRPMAGNPQAMIQLRQILKSRAAQYARAEHALDTSGKPVETSRAELAALLTNSGMLEN